MSESSDTVNPVVCNSNQPDDQDESTVKGATESNDSHDNIDLGSRVDSNDCDTKSNDDFEDDFDDFTEFASASNAIVTTSNNNQNNASNEAAIDSVDFADFSKCDITSDEDKTDPFPLNEMNKVFISTFIPSADEQLSSTLVQESSHTHVESHDKHLNHLLINSSFWQSHTSTQRKLKWQTSHAFKLFLASLNINPAQMHNGVPIFAADLGLLEPMKPCSSDATSSNFSPSTASENQQVTCQSITINGNTVSTSVPEPKSDDSHVQSSLNALQLTADSLDFLDERSNSTKEVKAISSLEEELLADLNVTSDQRNHSTESSGLPTVPADKILQDLLISSKGTTVTWSPVDARSESMNHVPCVEGENETNNQSSVHASVVKCFDGSNNSLNGDESDSKKANTSTLSPEAAQILDELPLLAFLRKKITPM